MSFRRRAPGTRALLRGAGAERFDGNTSDDLRRWYYPDAEFIYGLHVETIEALMERTEGGDLAWVLFPPEGFRL